MFQPRPPLDSGLESIPVQRVILGIPEMPLAFLGGTLVPQCDCAVKEGLPEHA